MYKFHAGGDVPRPMAGQGNQPEDRRTPINESSISLCAFACASPRLPRATARSKVALAAPCGEEQPQRSAVERDRAPQTLVEPCLMTIRVPKNLRAMRGRGRKAGWRESGKTCEVDDSVKVKKKRGI